MTRFALTYDVETRDPGHTVWSCHSGRLEGDLDDFRALASSLQDPDLWEDLTDAAAVIASGDAEDFAVRHADEPDFRLSMDLAKV